MHYNKATNSFKGHRAIALMVLCLFAFTAVFSFAAQGRKARTAAPGRTTDEKVYLKHADTLTYDMYGDHPGAQFLRGKVHFTHKGMDLTCDTAYYYESSNSFEAIGHVYMNQADTLQLVGKRAYYDGNSEMAHAWHDVILTHRKSKLYCDTLDYDRMYSTADAYGSTGIKLVEGKDVLTADWGRYHTDTRQSEFYYSVVLTNASGLRIDTDTLHYDNAKSMAHVIGTRLMPNGHNEPSVITNKDNRVLTENAWYNTSTEQSQLFGRSTLYNKEKTITADSLYHNEKTGENEGYGNVVYNDTLNKNIMLGEILHYNDQTGMGFATDSAVVIDYSQKDSLWMHGDTIRIRSYYMNTDSVQREVHCYFHVRAYRVDMQAVCDSLVILSKDSCMTMYRDPVVWNKGSQLLGEKIRVFFNDSTVRYAEVLNQALSVEQLKDTIHYNQVASRDMYAFFDDKGNVKENWAVSNVKIVYYPLDSDSTIIGVNCAETDTMKMFVTPDQQLEKIWMSASKGTLYPLTQTPPDKHKLPTFAWFNYMRPVSKEDIFVWKPKTKGLELKKEKQRVAPKRQQ